MKLYLDSFLKGISFAFGFSIFFVILFGLVYAAGFHGANEIIAGTFSGNYSFMNGNVGIGTESPLYLLDISDTVGPTIRQTHTNSGKTFSMRIDSSGDWYVYDENRGVAPLKVDTTGFIGINVTTPTALLELSCPTGFTSIKAAGRQLGCISTTESGTANDWKNTNNDCFTTYGGRLPTIAEWQIAMMNYALTDEIDDYEWTSTGGSTGGYFMAIGSGSIDTFNNAVWTTNYVYRCFIPR